MPRWLRRRLTLANVVAFLALFVALSATGWASRVPTALFALDAKNAHQVNGIDASTTPKAGTLLALNSKKQFPLSVFPAGAQGPQGKTGKTRPQGDPGAMGATGAQGPKGDTGATGSTGPTGPTGPQGGKGDTGATGTAGTNGTNGTNGGVGPPGPPGPPGPIQYQEFFAVMPPDNPTTIAVGANVQFPQNGPGQGTIARLANDAFLLPAIGTYRVAFTVPVTEAGQLELTLNGLVVPSAVFGRSAGSTPIAGEALITTSVINSVLTVMNPVGNVSALTITPAAGGSEPAAATLVIEQVS